MKRVTSTASGVYLVYEEGQRPVEGVAVFYFERFGFWQCQGCNVVARNEPRQYRQNCEHIALAKEQEKGEANG